MKKLVIYTSKTGFTKRYAEWIAEASGADIITCDEAKKKDSEYFEAYGNIAFGGWAMAGKIRKSDWFVKKADEWKNKKLALFCVGASPAENPDVPAILEKLVPAEHKSHLKAFYCQGGLDYDKMSVPMRVMMKAFAKSLSKKSATEKEKEMAKWISHSYDISDRKYAEAVAEYLK